MNFKFYETYFDSNYIITYHLSLLQNLQKVSILTEVKLDDLIAEKRFVELF